MLHGVVRCSLLIALLAPGGTAFSGSVEVDAALPTYEASPGVVGSISSAGSDTMANVAAFWGQGFQKYYPGVTIDSEAKGSSTAVPALSGSKANFGMMSRAPKPAEEADFAKTRGYKPVVLAAGIDMLAVYTHKDNPLKSLTLPEVDAIFSQVRNLGHAEDITSWGQLGVTGALAGRKISLYGRNAASGTYGFFKGAALAKGDYKTAVKEQPGSAAVVQGVGSDLAGIGYSGIGYKTADVNAIAIAPSAGEAPIAPTPENVYTGTYPLFRFLYVVVDYKPNSELDPLRAEFVKYIFSYEGQEAILKDGYFPLPAALAEVELAKVGL